MAIQLRRGSESDWENTSANIVVGEPVVTLDSNRLFIGTGTGAYTEFVNVAALAPSYDDSVNHYVGEYCAYGGRLYVCTTDTTGAWNSNDWTETDINAIVARLTA